MVLTHRCPGSPAAFPKGGWRQVDAEIDQDSLAIYGNRPFTLKRERKKKTNESIVSYAQYAPADSHLSVLLPIQLSITVPHSFPASPVILIPIGVAGASHCVCVCVCLCHTESKMQIVGSCLLQLLTRTC